MTDYTKATNFATKDSLPSGNPAKIVKGTEIDTEFNNIATAIATKANKASPVFTGTLTAANISTTGNTSLGNGPTDTLTINGVLVTATPTELNFLDGVTSNIQTQLDALQDLDADLTAIAALTPTDSNFIVGNGTTWVQESGATVRTSLGLTIGTDVQAYSPVLAATTASFTTADETKLDGIEAGAQVNDPTTLLDADIGVTVQGYDADTTKNDVANTFTANQTFDNGIIEEYSATGTSGAVTIDLDTGNNFSTAMAGAVTYTFSNAAVSGKVSAFTLKVVNDGNAITWPASVDWPSATAPTLSASGATDVFVFYTHDGGTTWYGFTAGQAMA